MYLCCFNRSTTLSVVLEEGFKCCLPPCFMYFEHPLNSIKFYSMLLAMTDMMEQCRIHLLSCRQ